MESTIKAHLKQEKGMEKENKYGLMAWNMKGIGRMIKCMAKETDIFYSGCLFRRLSIRKKMWKR